MARSKNPKTDGIMEYVMKHMVTRTMLGEGSFRDVKNGIIIFEFSKEDATETINELIKRTL